MAGRRRFLLPAAAVLICLSPASAVAAEQARAVRLRDAVAALPTAGEAPRDGYGRASFKHWVDTDGDGCDTRAEVLLEEATTPPDVGPGCKISGGEWRSYYDDVAVARAGALDVDHVVPLAEAWDSGAHAWDADRRRAYANDLDEPRALVAVTARTNRSKGDRDPGEWLPPDEQARCRYAADWLTVKIRWQLAADPQEKASLAELVAACPDEPLDATPAG